jgi:hypothetical protein
VSVGRAACEPATRHATRFASAMTANPAHQQLAEGLAISDLEGKTTGFPIPRPQALRYHAACKKRRVGFNHHGDRRARQPADAGAVLSRPHGSQAHGNGKPI